MAITAAKFQDISLGPDSRRSPFISELVRITGATGAAGDTAPYTPQFGKAVEIVGGAFRISAVDPVTGIATIQAKVAIGNDAVLVEMLCKL
jgi:hypothetical protein